MMSKNIIHFFDLDGTLWRTDAKWWVVDKENATEPLMKISQEEGSLICGGFYKKYNYAISYNGIDGWLSPKIYQKLCVNKRITLDRLGLSFREFHEKEYLDEQAESLTFLIEHIEHLKDSKDTIALLTARGSRELHDKMLDKLKEKMDEHKLNLDIEKLYFVNDENLARHDGLSHERKVAVIIEHIVGYRVRDNRFYPIQQESYDEIHFYDDEDRNVKHCLEINEIISSMLTLTDFQLAEDIREHLTENEVKLHVHKITNNKVNPFTSNTIIIEI